MWGASPFGFAVATGTVFDAAVIDCWGVVTRHCSHNARSVSGAVNGCLLRWVFTF